MWVYRSMQIPMNVFDFTVSRHRDGPDDFLVARHFTGKLMADCYSGYQAALYDKDEASVSKTGLQQKRLFHHAAVVNQAAQWESQGWFRISRRWNGKNGSTGWPPDCTDETAGDCR